jgi:hypothetical protein
MTSVFLLLNNENRERREKRNIVTTQIVNVKAHSAFRHFHERMISLERHKNLLNKWNSLFPITCLFFFFSKVYKNRKFYITCQTRGNFRKSFNLIKFDLISRTMSNLSRIFSLSTIFFLTLIVGRNESRGL